VLKGSIARSYAEAVFEIATEAGTLDRWHDDLRTLAEYFGNRRLVFVLREPKIAFARKEAIVRDLLADKLQPQALNLALLLVERGLVELAPAIFTQFELRYNDYKGLAVAQVTTAIPLDNALRAQISAELGQITGKRIILQERVDPSILGGAIARVGDTLIDGSLRRRFALLRQQIASGALGGPDDSTLAAILGPDGGDGSGGQGGPTAPFVVGPADTGQPNGGGGKHEG
jgi:F-type H+-transporting ATPase subunit delta